jgi:hypothetical protein
MLSINQGCRGYADVWYKYEGKLNGASEEF